MKLLIISDTHGNYPLALRAGEIAGTVDGIVHLGDGTDDADILAAVSGTPVVKVSGNCDSATAAPRECRGVYAGKRLFCTHGDEYNVKAGLGRLRQKALSENAHVVLYGHTHRAAIEKIDGVLFVNPGTLHKAAPAATFATLHIATDEVCAEIFTIDGEIARSCPVRLVHD